MTTTERKALTASLTPEEREKFSTACDSHFLDAIAAHGTIGDDVAYWDVIDAALLEATKDRPTMPELGPWSQEDTYLYNTIESTGDTRIYAAAHEDQDYQNRVAMGNVFPYGARGCKAAEAEARYTRAWRRLRQIAAKLNAGLDTSGNRWMISRRSVSGHVVALEYHPSIEPIAGAVAFASRADAAVAMMQLRAEGIALADLFPEGC